MHASNLITDLELSLHPGMQQNQMINSAKSPMQKTRVVLSIARNTVGSPKL